MKSSHGLIKDNRLIIKDNRLIIVTAEDYRKKKERRCDNGKRDFSKH